MLDPHSDVVDLYERYRSHEERCSGEVHLCARLLSHGGQDVQVQSNVEQCRGGQGQLGGQQQPHGLVELEQSDELELSDEQ